MGFSAALCRGLIEAPTSLVILQVKQRFSAALCRGLIEANRHTSNNHFSFQVFRGFMSRPH